MPAALILRFARTSRCAIVDSDTRRARAISLVVRPPRVRRVRATRASVDRTLELEPDSITIYQMELPFNTTISRDLLKGTAKFGDTEFSVKMNASPDAISGLNDLPVRTQGGATTYLRDIAQVRDGFSPQ